MATYKTGPAGDSHGARPLVCEGGPAAVGVAGPADALSGLAAEEAGRLWPHLAGEVHAREASCPDLSRPKKGT